MTRLLKMRNVKKSQNLKNKGSGRQRKVYEIQIQLLIVPQQSLFSVLYRIEILKSQKLRFLNPFQCFRTEQQVFLTLDEFSPSGFGEIPLSPLSLSSKIGLIKYFPKNEYLEVTVLPLNLDLTPIDYVIKILGESGDQEKKRVANNLTFINNFHKKPQKGFVLANSFEEILQSINSEFYKIYVIEMHPDGISEFSKVLMSEKLLHLMGTSREMFTDFVMKEQQIPDAFSKENYLRSWNEVMEASYQLNIAPRLWITTFEGINISTTINIKIDFFYDEEKQCISMVSAWIIKIDQNYDMLLNSERILTHSNHYFEKRHVQSEGELIEFKELVGIQKKKAAQKCCGYKIKNN